MRKIRLNNFIIDSDINSETRRKEDQAAMNALLRLPSDEKAFEMQQAKRKLVFKSASMTFGQNDKHRNTCTRCGDGTGSHSAIDCPWSNQLLLSPTN